MPVDNPPPVNFPPQRTSTHMRLPNPVPPRYAASVRERAGELPAKCLSGTTCISGLERALAVAEKRPGCPELATHTADEVKKMQTALSPVPTVMKGAAADWGPVTKWDAGNLDSEVGLGNWSGSGHMR